MTRARTRAPAGPASSGVRLARVISTPSESDLYSPIAVQHKADMRVFVTGGSGFLGSHVAERAKAQGHHVICLVRKTSNTTFLKELGVEIDPGELDAEHG